MKKPKKRKAKLAAEQFDRLHDDGVALTPHVDWSKARQPLQEQIAQAERDFKAGKAIKWRKVRRDV